MQLRKRLAEDARAARTRRAVVALEKGVVALEAAGLSY